LNELLFIVSQQSLLQIQIFRLLLPFAIWYDLNSDYYAEIIDLDLNLCWYISENFKHCKDPLLLALSPAADLFLSATSNAYSQSLILNTVTEDSNTDNDVFIISKFQLFVNHAQEINQVCPIKYWGSDDWYWLFIESYFVIIQVCL